MMSILRSDKPVIAKVHGAAYAAGCQLVATCDLAIGSTDAVFATPGVQIGLFCSTPMVALTRNVGRKEAMRMLLTGESVDAHKAKEIGLINDCVEPDRLEGEVLRLARVIASKSAKTLKMGKEAFYRQLEMPVEEAYEYASRVMAENMMALDAKEGVCAFLEKRKPVWKDR
jgi:enoyl-CoA hydratase/carnithine racemase